MELADVDGLDFSKAPGLLPAIVQHPGGGAVLMLGYMTPRARGDALASLDTLAQAIGERMAGRPEGSYTARLVAQGAKRVAQKVGEEGLEVALAGAGGSDAEVVAEAADLLYHLLVLLRVRGLSLEGVIGELRARDAG